jgi:hypothetical protein
MKCLCRRYFFGSFTASFVLSMALSTFSPAFSTGPFSGHALVASAIADKARTRMTLRMIFMVPIMSWPATVIVFNREHPGTRLTDTVRKGEVSFCAFNHANFSTIAADGKLID